MLSLMNSIFDTKVRPKTQISTFAILETNNSTIQECIFHVEKNQRPWVEGATYYVTVCVLYGSEVGTM